MGTLVYLPNSHPLDLPPERVLDAAKDAELDTVLVIGESGDIFYFAVSTGNIPELLLVLERAKKRLLESY